MSLMASTTRERARVDQEDLRERLATCHADAWAWSLTCCRGDRTEAEEVLHTAYLAVLGGKAAFHGRSAFRTWLFGVIRRSAQAARRTRWWRAALLERSYRHEVAGAHPGADADLAAADRGAALRRALASLPARQREVLHLVFFERCTVEGAAEIMGVSAGSARTHYARGKRRLAALLADYRGG